MLSAFFSIIINTIQINRRSDFSRELHSFATEVAPTKTKSLLSASAPLRLTKNPA